MAFDRKLTPGKAPRHRRPANAGRAWRSGYRSMAWCAGRLKDLAQWIWDKFRISLTEPTARRESKAMGFTKMTARPRHR